MTTPTIDRLASKLWDELSDPNGDYGFPHPSHVDDDAIREAADAEISATTTVLFQMVVDDNALAFLDYDLEAENAFDLLRGAIIQAVEQALYEKREEAKEYFEEDMAEQRLKSYDYEGWCNL